MKITIDIPEEYIKDIKDCIMIEHWLEDAVYAAEQGVYYE